jgi:hypothetical protein
MWIVSIVWALVVLLAAPAAEARLVRLQVQRREPVLSSKPFGRAGAYEKLVGVAHFALNPSLRQNAIIVDLPLAPKNGRGEVEFTADFFLLKPVDPRKGNGRLLYEVSNRGGKTLLSLLQKGESSLDPSTEAHFGDAALMQQGFAVLWLGWQWDVPDRPGLLRVDAPIATENGTAITGLVRANIVTSDRNQTAPLADRGHKAYPVVDPASPDHRMLVRDHVQDEPAAVPRDQWRFTGPDTVALDGGFEPGRIYDVVYRSRDPRVVGVGLAGTRDLVSFLKTDSSATNPLRGVRVAIALGVSQSGRFLRHFLYQGFNEDEQGRRVFDGVFIQVAGAGRGSFNHRFAQPSRDGYRHFNLLYPTDLFPFTDGPETDPETGERDGLLLRAMEHNVVPKVFHVFGSFEYWNRAASLVHTEPGGQRDAEIPATSRIYFIASTEHSASPPFPPAASTSRQFLGRAPTNPNSYAPVIRALVRALDAWVGDNVEPPPSQYPTVADATLIFPVAENWPALVGTELPLFPHDALRLDYGPEWKRGIITIEPPIVMGTGFGARVPLLDSDGNDLGGIRTPEIAVPLASQTGWNFRHPDIGAPDELAGTIGSYYPFARTIAERKAAADPRASIEERYRDKADYMSKVMAAARLLIDQRFLLPEDLPGIQERAARHYDWATSRPPSGGNDVSPSR